MPQPAKYSRRNHIVSFLLVGGTFGSITGPISAQGPGTQVVVLGTGMPMPDPDRSGPAVAVVVNGTAYLVDAGAGVMRRAEQARRNGVAALDGGKMDIAFLTHLHSDHTIGLPDLIHTGWVGGERASPLRLFGPPGTSAMAGHLTEAWKEDIRIRTVGPQPHTDNGWRVIARDIEAGVVYRDSNVTVTAFAVPHSNWEHAFGYRFDTRDRSVVISGDTRASDAVVTACHGCDVLVHEVYSTEKLAGRSAEWQSYHHGSHTSTVELAALATRAAPKLLVLYHQLYWGASDDDLLRELRTAGFTGAVVSARDLGIY